MTKHETGMKYVDCGIIKKVKRYSATATTNNNDNNKKKEEKML